MASFSCSCETGLSGEQVRGDVWMGYLPTSGPLKLVFSSNLDGMYGESTRAMLLELCASAGLDSGVLTVKDKGAYPFVIRARLESLLRKASNNHEIVVAPEAPLSGHVKEPVPQPERLRRSRLYLPGNQAKYMLNAALYSPDSVILDLEDSVAASAKEDARSMVRHGLLSLDFADCERMIRVNQGEAGVADLLALDDAPFELILIPKVERVEDVLVIANAAPGKLLMPIIESARGVLAADEIAGSHQQVVALTLGLEDLTADLGVVKTAAGAETLFARSMVVYAAKAHGLQAIDSVYGDVDDEVGLRASVREAKSLGFEGKGCVHPRQISVVHEEFAPTVDELERAHEIVDAFEEAEANGLGVVSLGSKMIDPPVVKRAMQLVRQAEHQSGTTAGSANR